MKDLLLKIYFLIFNPLYCRLSRELTLQCQEALQEMVSAQEKLVSTFSSELVHLHIRMQEYENQLSFSPTNHPAEESEEESNSEPNLPDNQISHICSKITNSSDILRTAKEWKLPISDIVELERKYSGMSPSAVRRARSLESENAELRHQLSELMLRQKRLERNIKELENTSSASKNVSAPTSVPELRM
jgi:hypothetical protein